jgi:hypothetical protein
MSFLESRVSPAASNPSTSASNAPAPAAPSPPTAPPKSADADAPEPETPREPALDLARRVFTAPADQAILDGLASPKEADRLGAMRSLLLRLDAHRQTPEQSQALQRLLASSLATDPSPSLATMTLPPLIDRLDLFKPGTSLSAPSVDAGFWTLDTLLDALSEPGLDPARADLLAKEADAVLGAGATQPLR